MSFAWTSDELHQRVRTGSVQRSGINCPRPIIHIVESVQRSRDMMGDGIGGHARGLYIGVLMQR